MPTGKLPPQAAPERMRSTNSSQKLVTTAERNDDTASSARQIEHHPRLAEGVGHRAEDRLRQAIGRECRRQQRRRGRRDREIGRDLRHHRIDGANAQRRAEDQEADDVERSVHLRRFSTGAAQRISRAARDGRRTEHHRRAPVDDGRLRAAMGEAEAVDDRTERLAEIERRRMQRGRRAARGLRQVGDMDLDAGMQQVEAEAERARRPRSGPARADAARSARGWPPR